MSNTQTSRASQQDVAQANVAMQSLLSSPSDTIRNSAEAMAELHECLVGMARRESVLRNQLEETSAEHAIALSSATDLTAREAASNKTAVAAAGPGAELSSQLRDGLAQGLAQAQQGVLHLRSDLQCAREERERHDAELAALRAQHAAQMGAMHEDREQAVSELRRRKRGCVEPQHAFARCMYTWRFDLTSRQDAPP